MPRSSLVLGLLAVWLVAAPWARAEEVPVVDEVDPFLAAAESYDPAEDARALRRNRMLKWHQGLALSSLGLLTAQTVAGQMVYSSYHRPSLAGSQANLQTVHKALGYSTFGLYTLAASMALFAPEGREDESAESGSVGVHKALAWVHGTGMMVMPWFGLVTARYKVNNGADKNYARNLDTLRAAHLTAGYVTWAALGGAMLVIVLD